MKKFISFVLSVTMLCTCTFASTFNASAFDLDGGSCGANARYTYDSENDILNITGTGAIDSTAFLNDKTGYGFKVVINEGISSIGRNAFCGSYATYVKIAKSVSTIDYHAFAYSNNIQAIVIFNSNCVFDSDAINTENNSIFSDLTIYGYKNSTAEKYASDKGIPFAAIDGYDCTSGNHVLKVFPEFADGKAPTCTEDGCEYFGYCVMCYQNFENTLPALGHTPVDVEAVQPTCYDTGLTAGTKCSRCEKILSGVEEVPELGHDFGNGEMTCKRCGEENPDKALVAILHTYVDRKEATIYYYADGTSKTEFVNDNSTADTDDDDDYYYSDSSVSSNKTSKPKPSKILKVKKKKSKITVTWKKVSGISGYEIQYSLKKNMKKAKTKKLSSGKTKYTVKVKKGKKTYYIRVRTYKTVSGKKVYSKWSKVKKVKVK